MKCNVDIRPLKDLADIQTGPFGSQLHKEDYVEVGTPIVTVEHLGNRIFTEQNLPKVSDGDRKRLEKYLLSTGDIVFSRVGSVDRCSYVDEWHSGWMFSGRCLRIRPSECINPLYLYYYFCLKEVRQFVRNIAVGATMPSINTKLLGEVPVSVPSIQTQRRIAAILSALDDKIELNNKINANLEQQAQALFKAWFVDFKPFGGKMPEDWSVSSLADIAHYLNGLAMQKYRPLGEDGSIPVLKIKELRQGYCDAASDRCSAKIPPEYIIRDGDVIFSWSGSLLVDFWCGGKCGLNQHLFKVTSSHYDTWFFYSWTKYYLARFIAIATDKATTMGHIRRDALEDTKVLIPSEWNYQMLGNILAPMYRKIVYNRIVNRKLACLRDILLQRLMSGKISLYTN